MVYKIRKTTGKVTAISPGKSRRNQRSNIYLDGKFAFSLDNEVIVKKLIKVGQEFDPKKVQTLSNEDRFQRCLNLAFIFLSYRPRSESEVRERLKKRGCDEKDIEAAIPELKRMGYLDDAAFAEFWKENRSSFKPRSQRMLKLELRRKGVDSESIEQAVSDIDDSENAYRAAMDKSRTIPIADYEIFRNRLGGYLQRRGFGYRVISETVKKVWQERTQGLP